MKKNPKLNNLILLIIVIFFAAGLGCTFLFSRVEHIEDTNGPDDYSLTTITDENIIKRDIGSRNLHIGTDSFSDSVTISSGKFTGVYQVFETSFLFDSDFTMDLLSFQISSGNFKMCIVNNGEIIATVEPGISPTCHLEDLNGDFALVIAGESADFAFALDGLFCEQYGIGSSE